MGQWRSAALLRGMLRSRGFSPFTPSDSEDARRVAGCADGWRPRGTGRSQEDVVSDESRDLVRQLVQRFTRQQPRRKDRRSVGEGRGQCRRLALRSCLQSAGRASRDCVDRHGSFWSAQDRRRHVQGVHRHPDRVLSSRAHSDLSQPVDSGVLQRNEAPTRLASLGRGQTPSFVDGWRYRCTPATQTISMPGLSSPVSMTASSTFRGQPLRDVTGCSDQAVSTTWSASRVFFTVRGGPPNRLFRPLDRTLIATFPRLPIVAMAPIVALLATSASCKRQATVEHTKGAQPHPAEEAATDKERCRASTNTLPVAPLVVEWQDDDRPRSLTLGADGAVRSRDALIARISGPCILGAHGEVLLSVDRALDVAGAHNDHVGRFKKLAELHAQDDVIRVDEVFVDQDGVATAVDSEGALYLVPTDRPAFSLPGSVKGEVPRARRTALLLWQIAHRP